MTEHFSRTLRDLNLKATPKRLAILGLLASERVYLSPEELWHKLKNRFEAIGLPTVYRIMEELANGGIVTKIIHPNRQLYYFLCRNREHHHHFICLSCRRVEDLSLCGLDGIEREVGQRIGGQVVSHIMQVNGLCRRCLVATDQGQGGSS